MEASKENQQSKKKLKTVIKNDNNETIERIIKQDGID